MEKELKELLLKDLCGRLPYEVKVTTTNPAVKFGVISGISIENKISVRTKHADIVFNCIEVKPYLFPLSSMTEEQKVIYGDLCYAVIRSLAWDMQAALNELVDWLNKNHFDYRGLINKNLAINCTNLGIY